MGATAKHSSSSSSSSSSGSQCPYEYRYSVRDWSIISFGNEIVLSSFICNLDAYVLTFTYTANKPLVRVRVP